MICNSLKSRYNIAETDFEQSLIAEDCEKRCG